MRLCIGVDAARRCAERAPAPFRDELAAHVDALDPGATDGTAADDYERLWRLVVDGAGNLAYRLALNTLVAAGGADRPARPLARRGARPRARSAP